MLKNTRETSGLSLEEVSKDLNIPVISLNQIEEGNIGAFKDIFKLKEDIKEYAKYLGLNPNEVIDEFNEYLFEKTSKIPLNELEKAAKVNIDTDERIASPYTKAAKVNNNKQFIITIILILILVIIAIIWSIKQITIGNMTTNILSFFK